ncbi:Cupin_5-domain-containing protein [Sphaerulina musiva SO2202]|uniref:Cupin_5-domain-containing protein n=1 Tax=Sphaerulina musiva (strain SO2202) TaxID=692275 RepID=N1QNX8_SPHMS|nr:Cupin_5-domain-containing protein [Sphaerulina musiva SO2202]EMF17794.1 Cupin_5-domain-containing protein [Sphaerulina musiva SO2202]
MAVNAVPQDRDLLKPYFSSNDAHKDPPHLQATIKALGLISHPEGGYFVETDRDPLIIPNPLPKSSSPSSQADSTRNASTTIHYLLTPSSPLGTWHRNKARIIHTLHRGRGRYAIIHADEEKRWVKKARIEVFTVGQDVVKGEKLQWIVEGGKYKTSFLLPDDEEGGSEGLLISETVVPGFEYTDHDFMTRERLQALVTQDEAKLLDWMLKKG